MNAPDTIVRAIQALVPDGVVLLSGSAGADLHSDESDVDLVVLVHGVARSDAFDALALSLQASSAGTLQVLRSAYTPVIKLEWNKMVSVDIIVASLPVAVSRETWQRNWGRDRSMPVSPASMDVDDVSRRALHALWMCQNFYRLPENVKDVVRDVRTWARARGLYGTQLGFWGGVAWSLLVLYSRANSLREALAHIVAYDWSVPLTPKGSDDVVYPHGAVCCIMTYLEPAMNTTYTCNLITLREIILAAEATLGDVAVARPDARKEAATLDTTLPRFEHHCSIACENMQHRDFVLTRARHLMTQLERPDLFVRPRASFSFGVMTWGLQPLPGAWTAELHAELQQVAREWSARLSSVCNVIVSIV